MAIEAPGAAVTGPFPMTLRDHLSAIRREDPSR